MTENMMPLMKLRDLTDKELELILTWRNTDRVRYNMMNDRKISPAEHMEWYDRIRASENVKYLVFELDSEAAGLTYFTGIDREHGRCDWGFYLGKGDLPKGTGTQMGILSLQYAFEVLHIRKLCGQVLDFNAASRRVFEKLGFQPEGILRQHINRNGRYHDIILYAKFIDAWQWEKGGRRICNPNRN